MATIRVPTIDPARDRLAAKLNRALARLDRVPTRFREAEHADERFAIIRMQLAELNAAKGPWTAQTELLIGAAISP